VVRNREPVHWRDEDLYELGAQPIRGVRRASARAPVYRRLPWIRLTLASVALVTLVTIYAPERRMIEEEVIGSLLGAPPELLTPPSPWRDLATSDLAFALRDETLARLPMTHLAQMHEDGALRNVVEFGRFASGRPNLLVVIERPGATGLAQRSFYVELVLRAAQAGLSVARVNAEEPLLTRAGTIEIAPVRLESRSARACLAFRAIDADGGMARFGWLCDDEPSRADLACALDALVLRHRETGMPLGPPGTQASACPRPLDLLDLLVTASANLPAAGVEAPAATPADAPTGAPPPPPPRPPASRPPDQ
jgi:hypothetical protein